MLDGEFDDHCWQRASVVRLRNEAEHRQTKQPFVEGDDPTPRATVRLTYDGGYLYVAAEVPRDPELPADPPHLPGRTHDADLAGFDRLNLSIDVDRDYATWYQIDVDQRGWTADACWENRAWNCQRYIAAVADEHNWRIEMAIPFSELVGSPSRIGRHLGHGHLPRDADGRGGELDLPQRITATCRRVGVAEVRVTRCRFGVSAVVSKSFNGIGAHPDVAPSPCFSSLCLRSCPSPSRGEGLCHPRP